MRAPWLLAVSILGTTLAGTGVGSPTEPSPAPPPPAGALSGTVYDSVAGGPLAEADVQVLAESGGKSYDVRTDSAGRFAIDAVEAGSYLVGFFHPRLDSLGVDLPAARVVVTDDARAEVQLAVPSRETVVAAFCPDSIRNEATTLLLGYVRSARDGSAVRDASVSVYFSELGFEKKTLVNVRRGGIVQARSDGRFAACNLPVDAELVVRAAAGADTSGVLALRFPPSGILARDVFVATAAPREGGAATVNATPPAAARDTAAPAGVVGLARLVGRVVAQGGTPVAGANVSVWGEPGEIRTTANGDFEFDELPPGSTTLMVRAAGYEAVQRSIDLLTGAGRENVVEIVLPRPATTLAPITVEASANPILIRNGFEGRRATGTGRFLDDKELAKLKLPTTTTVLGRLPGLLLRTHSRGMRVFMRDPKGRACAPTVWVDGQMYSPAAEIDVDAVIDIDALADVNHIAGIEVYQRSTQVPLQWNSTSRSGCGVIVIWRANTRVMPAKKP